MDTVTCELCGETAEGLAILDHLRVMHAEDTEVQKWPDGTPVVVDATLAPEDFA